MNRQKLLDKIEAAWAAFQASYDGLAEVQLVQAGVVGQWSVKDLIAHVTTWEEEALKYLPLIANGGRPPRYKDQYGGLDAFNDLRTAEKRDLPLAEVLAQRDAVHAELMAYLQTAPEEFFTRETPFRRRLRFDTYSHYPLHTRAIQEWRDGRKDV